MRLKRGQSVTYEVNMVPMIDIVFQLIIFFLVSTQVKKSEVAELQLPVSARAEEVKPGKDMPLIINIIKPDLAKGKPYIALGNTFDLPELKRFMKERLAYYKALKQDMPILRIRADKDSQFQQVQEALIACRDVGIWQVRLTTLKRQF